MGKKLIKYSFGKTKVLTTDVISKTLDTIDSQDYLTIRRVDSPRSIKCQRGKGNYNGFDSSSNHHLVTLCGNAYSQKISLTSNLSENVTKTMLENILN